MNGPFREVESIGLVDLFRARNNGSASQHRFSFDGLEFTGSGKAGISLILRFLQREGVLANKTDEILVPQWLGSWVYFQMGYYAFPSTALSSKTKILFMYHQYGFPQKVDRLLDLAHDRGLIILEDCAHALAGKCGVLDLGFIGGYSLYSFSKYFFCYALGAVRSKDTGFLEYVRQQKVKTKTRVTLFNNAAKAIYEHSADRSSERLKSIALDLTLMSYALYDTGFRPMNTAERLARKKIDFELDVRQKYFKHFRERTNNLGICDHLEKDNVFPYMIPIIVADSARDKLVGKLRERGFMTKALRFDMNRFFIEPDFKFCVPIYCHSGIPEDKFEEQIETVLGVL